jgi:ZIP family zinc transporter
LRQCGGSQHNQRKQRTASPVTFFACAKSRANRKLPLLRALCNPHGKIVNNLVILVGLTLAAGLAMPFGAFLAIIGKFTSRFLEAEFTHSIMAFGGGALLSAVALVLVPYGISKLDPLIASTCLLVGGLIFMVLDIFLLKLMTPASQLVAMLLDFIPESIALGTAFAIGSTDALLLAALITLQNIPEGFNAYRELNSSSNFGPKKIMVIFFLMAFLGPVSGVSSYLWLQDKTSQRDLKFWKACTESEDATPRA